MKVEVTFEGVSSPQELREKLADVGVFVGIEGMDRVIRAFAGSTAAFQSQFDNGVYHAPVWMDGRDMATLCARMELPWSEDLRQIMNNHVVVHW